jgi:hypothetical protein
LIDRVAQTLLKFLLPRIEAALKVQPRYLSIESAGKYIDKTYQGMKSTLKAHEKERPVAYIGGVPRIDIHDIDRLCANLKNRS